jgi:diguanylate cyclase (GGDEF)-like protein
LLAIADAVHLKVGTGRAPVNHWGALLTVALDRRMVMRELQRRENQLRAAALYDHLTGLPNRTLFLDRLRQAIERAKRDPDQRFGVLFVDLDGFKVVNDSMGHATGDRLLVLVAKRLQDALRASDTAARYGGDEFLVLLDGIEEPDSPTKVAERLHAALAQPFQVDDLELVVGASIGIAVGGSGDQDADDLLRDADIAMYSAKSQRKGSHVIFDAEMRVKAVARLQLETALRRALEHRQFEVHYQPIMRMPTGQVAGSRRWCAGATPSVACCVQPTSSPSPRKPG